MKHSMKMMLAVLAMMTFSACSTPQTVPPGHVGVKVYLYGTEKGVDHEVLGVGRYWISYNEALYVFPTFEQNPKWTKGTEQDSGREVEFQTREGMAVNADFAATYTIDNKNVATVFSKYRKGVEEINKGPLRNIVRDAVGEVASKLAVEDVYGEGKAKMMTDIENLVKVRAAESGLTVTNVSLLGTVRLPDSVNTALNAKMEATQRAQQRENELREAEAQAKKEVAAAEGEAKKQQALAAGRAASVLVEAEAQAKANRILAASLTQELIEMRKIEKWDGVLPQFGGSGSSPVSVVHLSPMSRKSAPEAQASAQ